ncbi:MAG TPA: hypothetical protein ENJ51_08485 [Leucothrix mucor]|uniref:Uncharacterized protein n=1 Tax=Leucothrix mucor TaxID=45248 RepID=A0A7V2T3R1_LEUMU|nr:hypothetical protein [Leucothrix mucor]
MKAELQFFMLPSDAKDFINFAKDHIETITADNHFAIGDCLLEFQPSELIENTLTVGTLSINSGGLDDGCRDHLFANKTYRILRNWIKDHYDNRLSSWIETQESNIGRTRNQWLAPDAKRWKQQNNDAVMRFSLQSPVFFSIAPEFSNMGSIEPKGEKFKARS